MKRFAALLGLLLAACGSSSGSSGSDAGWDECSAWVGQPVLEVPWDEGCLAGESIQGAASVECDGRRHWWNDTVHGLEGELVVAWPASGSRSIDPGTCAPS